MSSGARDIEPGKLLIAPPMVQDPNFFRSVVLLCEHGPEGSFGLILNRRVDVETDFLVTELTGYDGGFLLGGPVQTDTLHFLHHFEEVPESVPFMAGVYWGGDFESVKDICRNRPVAEDELKLYIGYAGWGAGQLLDEIEAGGWIVAPGDPEAVFAQEPSELWRKRLRQLGGEYAVMANYPIDPRMN
jgi:putative transcriptional regulator